MCPSEKSEQVLTVTAFTQWFCEFTNLCFIYPALHVCNFFRAGDLEALAAFDRLDEIRGLLQRFMRAGIQPGIPPAQT